MDSTASPLLSSGGYGALLRHFEQGLQSNSSGIDASAIVSDPAITDTDLKIIIGYLNNGNGQAPNGEGRTELAQRLRQLVDAAVAAETRNDQDREITLTPRALSNEMQHDAVHASSERMDDIALGASGRMTPIVVRSLRQAAGWVPISHWDGGNNTLQNKKGLERLRHAYLAQAMEKGLSLEAAEQQCQREYIAIVPRYRVPHIACEPRPDLVDTSRPTRTWVDLSPQAATDFDKILPQYSPRESISFNTLCGRWGIGEGGHALVRHQIKEVVQRLRDERIKHKMAEGLDEAAAKEAVNTGYISVIERKTYLEYRIRPAALPEIEARLREMFPGREPDVNVRGR